MHKNMGKYTCTCNDIQTGAYLDVEGKFFHFTQNRVHDTRSIFKYSFHYEDYERIIFFLYSMSSEIYTDNEHGVKMLRQFWSTNHIAYILEAPPDYHFTKNLPKQTSTTEGEELIVKCTLNTYKAPVKWYKEKKEITSEDSRYEIDKDIIGVCTLKIKNPTKDDAGKYSCKIVGREKEKNCYTKTEVVVKGTESWVHPGKFFSASTG